LPISPQIDNTPPLQRARILEQCTEIAAVIDSDFYGRDEPGIDVPGMGKIHNYVEISAADRVANPTSFISALGVDKSDGVTVSWSEFLQSPREFVHGEDTSWQDISKLISDNERASLFSLYLTRRQEPPIS